MDKLFYVYLLIDTSNNKVFYVGKGHGNRMFRHRDKAIHGSHHNKHVQNKILKLIKNNIDIKYEKIFESYNEIEVLNKEIEIISFYGITNLCNISGGGDGLSGFKVSESTKQKLREKCFQRNMCGKNNPNYGGGHWSDETKKRFSEYRKSVMIGSNNPFFGKKHSDEAKAKISKIHKGKTISEEQKQIVRSKLIGTKRPENAITSSGENNCKAKLKFKQVLEIRDKYNNYHIPQAQLAIEYSVDKTTISNIIVRKTWNKEDSYYNK